MDEDFTDAEIELIDFMIKSTLRGAAADMVPRHKAFAGLCAKVQKKRKGASNAKLSEV